MGLGRRKVELDDPRGWVFNRMADVYDARPPYPDALLDMLAALAGPQPSTHAIERAPRLARVLDLGAGIGHLALPLAARGLDVCAVEPAESMLRRLRDEAETRGLRLQTLHAKAELVPLEADSVDLVLIADALHFMDAELTGRELARLLTQTGALALITCDFAPTAFMDALASLMNEAAPRRLRSVSGPSAQLAAVAGVTLAETHVFIDRSPLDDAQLERILRTISFLGPAMNEARFSAFHARVRALPERVWARRSTVRIGRRV